MSFLVRLLVSGMALGLGVVFLGWLVRPDVRHVPPPPDPMALARVEALRDISFDPEEAPRVQRDVDYDHAPPDASWRPKGEPPILEDFVAAGKLPPVAERVGPEPIVVEGVDGIGQHGGTWLRLSDPVENINIMSHRLSTATLVRWSPFGYPIVPHMAKRFEVSEDNRIFTFELRRGVCWSDGHPLTTEDILYWWDHEVCDTTFTPDLPNFLKVRNQPCQVEKVDDYTVRFIFPYPNGIFLSRMACPEGIAVLSAPAHYLRPYHPTLGDPELIERTMESRKLASPLSVYGDVKAVDNPEHPRLWPWIYRTYHVGSPQAFVRNPYCPMVDTAGNQLPYIDRILFQEVASDMVSIKIANGETSLQGRHNIKYSDYTFLMGNRARGGYEVYHWYPGNRSEFVMSPNLNLRIDPARPETAKKRELLRDPRFRQALSIAIKRRDIAFAECNGQTEPAQDAPGPASLFHDPVLYASNVEYDPARANAILDDLGLTRRDREGFRTFRDGTRMTFFLNFTNYTGGSQFVVDDWAAVGIRLVQRERSRPLFYTEKAGLQHDFNVWSGSSEYTPLLDPRHIIPVNMESNFALAYARWYYRGGLYNPAVAGYPGCAEPPAGGPIREALERYEAACAERDPTRQADLFREVMRLSAENTWSISLTTPPPILMAVKNGFRNVPRKAVEQWMFLSPANTCPETYYFEENQDSPGARAQIETAISAITPRPGSAAGGTEAASGDRLALLLKLLVAATTLLALLLIALRHPYIGRRLVIMVPTLLIISVTAFIVIQLPPGDFVTSRIIALQEAGESADLQALRDLRVTFHLDDSPVEQYARWLGLVWFKTFDARDRGLLQGYLGRSMANGAAVNDLVGDRILLTFLISLGTILFTWAVALPIGIYSAVRQYSIGDYVMTFIGFIGMCVPPFLLALLLMYFSAEFLGIPVSGLFSSQYGAQPEWDLPKFIDLLQHIWVPIAVMGVGGTAGMIRVMRGNLLDELRRPYVTTALAKGMRPMRLLLKYPVRLALNPFISGIGTLFPALVSGGAIVAVVLSLPTVGPLMLNALMSEDMYLAGSLLMVLSLLGVLGTLVSDLLLLWLDPRIRFQGGAR